MATGSGQARKTVTVLFCDVTGSTALGERLDPEALREVIQSFFRHMREVIERHGGTVEKFIGDAVMAVFGVPRVREDDALRAVRAAADMQAALAEANEGFERDLGTRIEARIGVNTGEVIAGDPSTGESFVSGDAVNLAARLEQAAAPGEVFLGATTYRLVRAAVIAEPLAPLDLKGKTEPVEAYRLVVVESGGEMLPRRLDAPLVGRERELDALKRIYDEAVEAPACRLVTVTGDAGIGKSRLAHELLTAVSPKASVLRGRCLPYGDGITFWPVIEILEAAAAPEDLSALVSGGATGSIQETFLAVRRWLEQLAAERPVVVVFDDIQWAEDAFLDLVQYLASFVAARPLLVVCLARPELLDARPDWTQVGESIRLERLAAGPSETMVANLLGSEAMPAEVAERIVAAAAGNPLFIEEMLRMLVDSGVIARRDGGWVLAGDMSALGAPETVQAVIAARLDRLSPEERTVVQSASVVGEVFWWGAVAQLTEDATGISTGRHLQAFVRKDLIRPDPSTFFGEDAFRFGHLLIRDVAYESLPKKSRAALHERFAHWVDERAGERSAEYDEIIGYHAEQAYRYLTELAPPNERTAALAEIVVERLVSAGERAFAREDMKAAANLLGRAAALVPAADPRRARLLMSLGQAVADSGSLEDSLRIFDEAIAGAREAGDRRLELQSAMRRLHVHMISATQMSHAEGLAEAEPARIELEELGYDAGVADALKVIGAVYSWAGRLEDSIAVFRRIADLARRSGDRRLEVQSLHWTCLSYEQGLTPVEECLARINELIDARDLRASFRWKRFVGLLEAMRGRFAEARSLTAQGMEAARELGMEMELAGSQLRDAGAVEYLAGDLAASEAYFREAVSILERIGDAGHLASLAPELAWVLLARGDRDAEALAMVELTEASMIEDDVDAVVRAYAAKAVLLSRAGEFDEAERYARDTVERSWATEYAVLRAISMEALAEVLGRAGRMAEAVEAHSNAIAAYEAKGDVTGAEAARRSFAGVRAAMAR